MRLEPIFKIENNKLFFIETDSDAHFESPLECSLKEFLSDSFNALFAGKFLLLNIEQSDIELGEEVYAEDTLASLREKLLLCDEGNRYVVFVPHTEKNLSESENLESFINTFNHTARRVQDCTSVAGFDLSNFIELTNGSLSTQKQFIDTLAKKHAQYVYFVKTETAQSVGLNPAENTFVLY